MMKGEKEYQAWLQKVWKKWAPTLMLQVHEVTFERNERFFMGCSLRYPYLDPSIYYSQKSLKAWKDDPKEHEKTVVHEFCHLMTDPLYVKATERYVGKEEIENERERLTDHITRVVMTLSK